VRESIRIGCGAAGEPDRPALARQLVQEGDVDYVCFDTLAERTLASAQLRRAADPTTGYDLFLRPRVGELLACARERGVRLLGNMGAANPRAAGQVLLEMARRAGLPNLSVAVVTGDDIVDGVRDGELPITLWDPADELEALRSRMVSANVYLGMAPILEALARGADVVVTGRGADVAPYMAALVHEFGWDLSDHDLLARAAVIGHLLECGRCVTGTCFEEPAFGRHVPDPSSVSMPIGEVDPDGSAVITKVPGTGGRVSRPTCGEQLIHETGDPTRYLTPDVTLDMSRVRLEEVGIDRVRVTGARGGPPPETLKVLLGIDEGFIAEGEVSFAGLGAVDKANAMARIVLDRIAATEVEMLDQRHDVIGLNSVLGPATPDGPQPFDVRLRIACRVRTREETEAFSLECQDLWWAPGVGGGGVRTSARPVLAMHSASIARELVSPAVAMAVHHLDPEPVDAAG
jgi:Acyclic terpene utilisation family protein AtuA